MRNGVCGLQFDRKDISMNKFAVCCLEAQFHVFDARTQHPKKVGHQRPGSEKPLPFWRHGWLGQLRSVRVLAQMG